MGRLKRFLKGTFFIIGYLVVAKLFAIPPPQHSAGPGASSFFIALKTSVPDLFTFNSLALKIAFSAP